MMQDETLTTPEEVEATIADLCVLHERWAMEEGRTFDLDAFAADIYARAHTGNTSIILRYNDDGRPIAMMELNFAYDPAISDWSCFADKGYVVAEYRGMGIFPEMCHTALEFAKKRGAAYGWLTVDADNTTARKVYEAHGGKVASVIYKRELK